MQAIMEEVLLTTRTIESRPEILSFDSGDECSLDHWFEVYWLVEEEFAFAREADSEQLGPKFGRQLEVKPASTDQHFPGDIVR